MPNPLLPSAMSPPQPSRTSPSVLLAMEDQWWHDQGSSRHALPPQSSIEAEALVWAPRSMLLEVSTLNGDARYASEIIAQDIEAQALFAEPVHVLVHAVERFHGGFQALYSTVSLQQWQALVAQVAAQPESFAVHALNSLVFRACEPQVGVLLARDDRLFLLWRDKGQFHLRTTPNGLSSDPDALQQMLFPGGHEENPAWPFQTLRCLDLRNPSEALDGTARPPEWPSAIRYESWVLHEPQGAFSNTQLRDWLARLRRPDLCLTAHQQLAWWTRQHWVGLRRAHMMACALALLGASWIWLGVWRQHNVLIEQGRTLDGLRTKLSQTRALTSPSPETLRQVEFLRHARHAGLVKQEALAHWLDDLRQAFPSELLLLGVRLEWPTTEGKRDATVLPRGLRIDASFAESSRDKPAALATLVRRLEQQGYSVQSLQRPAAAGAEATTSEVVSYLMTPRSEGRR